MLLLLVSLYPLYLTYIVVQNVTSSKVFLDKYGDFLAMFWTVFSMMALLETYLGGFWGFLGWFRLVLLLSLYNNDIRGWLFDQIGFMFFQMETLMKHYAPVVWKYDKQMQKSLCGTRGLNVFSSMSMWLQSGFRGLF